MNPHKLYLGIFAALFLTAAIAGSAWREHVRDDARRDAVLETQKSDIAELQRGIATARSEAESQIADWERRRRDLEIRPAQAPQIIRELIPTQTPIQPASPAPTQTAPNAPSVVLSKQQEIDLAQYAVSCKECSLERDQLEQQVKDQNEIISRQKVEIDAAKKSAKGGSVWQRTVRIAKWGAIFGGVGYVLGRAQR